MYGLREISREIEHLDGTKEKQVMDFDFSKIDYDSFDIKVNVGTATYWSQLMQVQTMDAFFKNGIIDDALIYLEHIPDGYVAEKEEIMKELKMKRAREGVLSTEIPPMSTEMKGGAQK